MCKHLVVVLEHVTAKRGHGGSGRELAREGASLRWDPVRPLTGPGDWLARIQQQRLTLVDRLLNTLENGDRLDWQNNAESFVYGGTWRGKFYTSKQEAYAVEEGGSWLVITVIVKYLGDVERESCSSRTIRGTRSHICGYATNRASRNDPHH
jgi:hypothetical protein